MRTRGWPAASRLPLMPKALTETGLCARHPDPGLWTSSRPSDRERAAAICAWCPALAACREWSLGLPWSDTTIYGGLGSRGRQQLRKAAREPVAAPPAGEEITPAA